MKISLNHTIKLKLTLVNNFLYLPKKLANKNLVEKPAKMATKFSIDSSQLLLLL